MNCSTNAFRHSDAFKKRQNSFLTPARMTYVRPLHRNATLYAC